MWKKWNYFSLYLLFVALFFFLRSALCTVCSDYHSRLLLNRPGAATLNPTYFTIFAFVFLSSDFQKLCAFGGQRLKKHLKSTRPSDFPCREAWHFGAELSLVFMRAGHPAAGGGTWRWGISQTPPPRAVPAYMYERLLSEYRQFF